jgi:sec-independent protein translocase protein TatC
MEEKFLKWDLKKGLLDNIGKIKSHLLVPVISIIGLTVAGFFFSDYIIEIINRPFIATGNKLNLFNIIEGFMLRIKASLVAALLVSMIVIVLEIWTFIKSRISRENRNFFRITIISALILFYAGVVITYLYLLPGAIQVMLAFTPENMVNNVSAGRYMSFMMFFCFSMGLVCELPIAIMILTKLGIVTPEMLSKKRKYAIVIIWIAAAVITPTVDPLTQTIVAVPMMLLYEVSILISKFIVKKKKEAEE